MTLAQWCTDQLKPTHSWLWLLVVRVIRLGALRWYAAQTRDPGVQFSWGNRLLTLPFSHNLPLYKAFTPQYDEPLRHWVQKTRPLRVINVGANVGDTYALLTENVPASVLAVEGDPQYLSFLRQAMKGDAHSAGAETFVGDGTMSLQRIVSEHGTSRLEATSARKSGQKGSVLPSLDELLQRQLYRAWQMPDALVIDTDGFDWRVLRGAEKTLQSHPLLFFEYYPDLLELQGEDASQLWSWLGARGYTCVWLYTNTGSYLGKFSLQKHGGWLLQLPHKLKQTPHIPYVDVVAR